MRTFLDAILSGTLAGIEVAPMFDAEKSMDRASTIVLVAAHPTYLEHTELDGDEARRGADTPAANGYTTLFNFRPPADQIENGLLVDLSPDETMFAVWAKDGSCRVALVPSHRSGPIAAAIYGVS